jgi:hypothetical protein
MLRTVMSHDTLTEELVTGYRVYAAPTDLDITAAVDPPATTPFCGAIASFTLSYITTNGPG